MLVFRGVDHTMNFLIIYSIVFSKVESFTRPVSPVPLGAVFQTRPSTENVLRIHCVHPGKLQQKYIWSAPTIVVNGVINLVNGWTYMGLPGVEKTLNKWSYGSIYFYIIGRGGPPCRSPCFFFGKMVPHFQDLTSAPSAEHRPIHQRFCQVLQKSGDHHHFRDVLKYYPCRK